jgi:curved DNA-binding protein CbpA/ketosteroid isomerase-like protein
MPAENVRRLVRTLAAHPVLPPVEALPVDDETFAALVADLARGPGSTHWDVLREVGEEVVIPVDELARRAEFLLACLVLPMAGTHYEVLGLERDAPAHEIRRRWATLIQRYHPDHFGGGNGRSGWLDAQARRLIEAYHALKDPERRRQYDAELAGEAAREPADPPRSLRPEGRPRFRAASSWRWAPAGILVVGVVAGGWVLTRPPARPLPSAPLPADPRLLESWGAGAASTASTTGRAAEPTTTQRPGTPELLPPTDRAEAGAALSTRAGNRAEPSDPVTRASAARGSRASGPPAPAGTASQAAPAPIALRASLPEEPRPAAARSGEAPGGGASLEVRDSVATAAPGVALDPGPLVVVEAFRGAYERRDLPAVMALLGTDVRERQTAGRAAVERLYAGNFALLAGIHYELSQVEVRPEESGPEELIVTARFRIRATKVGPPASPLDVAGPVRWVLRREAGALRIVAIDYEMVNQ